jgi:FtsP/CotA-like multicopper oxidase with cupredoxin domain
MEPQSRRAFLGLTGAAVAGIGIVSVTAALHPNDSDAATQPTPEAETLTPFKDELRIPPVVRPSSNGLTEIAAKPARIRLHSQLPATPMWTYGGHYPGPTIEVRRGERARIAWRNELNGTTPVKGVWVAAAAGGSLLDAYNRPGAEGGKSRPEVEALTAWTSTHLHGAHQQAAGDGGPDLAVTPGSAQLVEYPNDVDATHLWYHDHAMPVTALNVLAGLMGHYIVRDKDENRLGLPSGKYEIPLAISDVNFDTDDKGRLTGQILAKRVVQTPLSQITDDALPAAVAFLGPYTLVNGVVWPHLDVEARAYRFRIVNTSVARAYRMVVVDEATGQAVKGAMKLIGTDLGLIGKPVTIDEALTLNPAERADIVIDFAAFPGQKLKLVNTVAGVPAGTAVAAAGVAFPDIMEFRVGRRTGGALRLPATLAPSFKRLTSADVPKNAVERFVVLSIAGGMLQLWEMQQVPNDTQLGVGVVQIALPDGVRTLRRVATAFEDTTTFFAAAGSWEKWHFISIAPPGLVVTHPMHIHVMDFQVIGRQSLDVSGFDLGVGGTKTPLKPGAALPVAPEEAGNKDTIGVAQNSIVTLAGRYRSGSGRYMYHCHILDHEDEGMMRPLIVMPPAVLNIHQKMASMQAGMTAMPGMTGHN